MTLVSYIAKPNTFVVLLSILHHQHETAGQDQAFKPEIVLGYNKTKGDVDVLDKTVKVQQKGGL